MDKSNIVRVVSLFLLILTLTTLLSFPAYAELPALPDMSNVDAVCIINTEYQTVVVEKNMKKVIYPASTVKLMTALVAAEHYANDLNTHITVTAEMLDAVSGRYLGLEIGERLRVFDLLHIMLVGGYNDAAVILAYASTGSVETFCEKMNTKAKAIGANDTKYTNPTGLHDDNMVTTAYDTALIGLEIMKNETLFNITKTLKYTIPATNKSDSHAIYNRNPLISGEGEEHYSYAEGMNAGATTEGGDCVVTAGRFKSDIGVDVDELPDELSYVCVVMGGRTPSANDKRNHACITAKNVLRYVLKNFEIRHLYSAKHSVTSLPVRFSATEESVKIKPKRDLYALLHTGVDLEKEVQFDIELVPKQLDAPIALEQSVGTIKAIYDGKLLDSTELVTSTAIDSHGFLIFMYQVKQVTQHPVFIIVLLLAVAGIIYLLLKRFPLNKNKDRHKRNRYF